MQAQSPYLKLGKDSSSSTSPRKRKLQSQVASTSNNSNEYDNIHLLSGENRAAKAVAAVAVGGSGIAAAMDIGHLLSDLAAIPEQDSPYYHHRGGVTPSPIYPLRKDRDALTEKIQLLEKQIKTLQQSNRELSMKRVFEQESFRQTLKVERGKLEKVITSLSTKLRDRNELISEWISFVLNQPQFLNESTFFQSNHLLEIMNRTILVLPKLKSILKPTMDSINEFETNRKSRESSTNPNLFRNEGELFGEYAEGENPDDDFKVSPMTAGEEGKAGGSGRKKQKKRTPTDKQVLRDILANQELLLSESDREGTEGGGGGGGGSAGNRRKMMTGDSDAEELLSAIDEQMKAISFLNNEQSDRQVSLSTDDEKGGRHKHVMFRDSSDQDISDSDQNPSTKKKGGKKQKKGAVALKGAPPLPVKMGNAVTFSEKHQTQRTKRVEEENVTSAEIGKLLYESQVMHNNIFQISKEAEQQQVDKNNIINNHNQLQNHRNDNNNNNINSNNNSNNINSNSNSNPTNNNTNIFNTLFRDTPEASIDKLLVGKDEMESASAEPDREKAEEAVPVNQQDQSAAITKEGKDGRKEGEEANAGAVKEEKKTTTAVVAVAVTVTNTATAAPTPSSNTLLSPATLKLIEANRKLNTVDEFMKSIDSEDFSYDEVLKELFDSVSGLSGSIEDIDDDTNQLISKTTQSPKSKGSRKNKAGKRGSGDFGVKAPRDSGLILNTPLSNPQDLLMKLKDAKINNKDASSGTMPQPLHPTVLAETSPSRGGASSSGSHAPAPANQKEVHNDQQSPSATSILPGAAKKAKKKGSLKAKERRGSETVKEEDDAEVDAENLAAGGVISQADHEKLLRSTNRLIENIQQFVNQSQAATNDPPSSPKSKSVVGAAKPSDQSKSKAGSSETASSDFNSLKLGGQLDNDP